MALGIHTHDAATLHVTGRAQYTDDIPLPAKHLHLAFGLSTIAHGDIVSLDLNAVRAAKGVHSVLLADDIAGQNNASPTVDDEPVLADGVVKYLGQPIFLVIADSHLAARKAARLADIKYKPRDAIVSMEQAIKAQDLFEEPIVWRKGDADQALKDAPHQISGAIDIGGQEHFYLEGQAAIALPQENGDMLVHSSTQHPTEVQHKVALCLNLPFNAIRVETRRMGGGFGGKESQANALACACALAAQKTGRACKMRYDRDDDIMITGKRHDFHITYRVGFSDQGRILALQMEHHVRCGWAQEASLAVCDRAMLHSDNAYHLPHATLRSYRYRTNTQSATAFRGFGGPQAIAAIETIIDEIGRALNLDPLLIRQKNYYKTGETTPYGMTVEDSVIDPLCNQLVAQSDYHKRRAEIEAHNATNPLLRRGIALTPVKFGVSFTLSKLNQAGALVHIYSDGSVHLNHGGTEMGQGLFIKVAQIAAHEFTLPLSSIKISAADTAKVPNTSATAASASTDMNGMAVKFACETLKKRLCDMLAQHWQTDRTLYFENGHICAGNQSMSFEDAANLAWQKRISLSTTGYYATPKLDWDRKRGQGRPFYYFTYGAAVSEVLLDTLTGEYRITRCDILHDVGRSLNPAIDIGQIEGGFVQGAGWLTTEELLWNKEGKLLTHAPSTYKIPACSDRPAQFNVTLFENENVQNTIYRSKAVGEPPLMLGPSALCALGHAVGGKLNTPATFERVLMAWHNRDA